MEKSSLLAHLYSDHLKPEFSGLIILFLSEQQTLELLYYAVNELFHSYRIYT